MKPSSKNSEQAALPQRPLEVQAKLDAFRKEIGPAPVANLNKNVLKQKASVAGGIESEPSASMPQTTGSQSWATLTPEQVAKTRAAWAKM